MTTPSMVGGQIRFKRLTNDLNEADYARFKAHFWMHLLNEGKFPTKWLKPNSKGTRVNFTCFNINHTYSDGLKELTAYLNSINEKYNFDFKISQPTQHC